MIMPSWMMAVSRHFATIVIIVGGMWWLATPRAEQFIRQAVNDRLTRVEVKLDELKNSVDEAVRRLNRIDPDGLN